MLEYIVKFQMIKNQKIVDNKTFRTTKKKYDMIKKYTRNTLSGIGKKQKPKYGGR